MVKSNQGGPQNSITRHNTIANVMRPEVTKAYIRALKAEGDLEYKALD